MATPEALPPAPEFQPKPKLSKKERRELQEKQKAAKAAARGEAPPQPTKKKSQQHQQQPANSSSSSTPSAQQSNARRGRPTKPTHIFSHLPEYSLQKSSTLGADLTMYDIHPTAVALGLRFADRSLNLDANERALALLETIKCVVRDYHCPAGVVLKWDLSKKICAVFQFLTDCRPHSISMGNAMQFVRSMVSKIPPTLSDEEALDEITQRIDEFIKLRVTAAGEMIAQTAEKKIVDGDVVLVYGRCEVALRCLSLASKNGKKFHVVVVDSAPDRAGRVSLTSLTSIGIPCTYVLLNACSYVIKNVTKVLLGASAIMSNGTVYAPVGTALVAMTAASKNVPVMFCCETYKLCDKVQLDSIVNNVLGDPDQVVQGDTSLSQWRQVDNLKVVNIQHDITPMSFVGSVVTEVGMIPPTAVPVLIREYRRDDAVQSTL